MNQNLSFSPAATKPVAKRNSAVFWLLCLVICYQAGYQVYMSFVLGRDSTALDPWCNGAQGSAQHCVEAQLFQGWQTAGHDGAADLHESEDLLTIAHGSHPEAVSTTQSIPSVATAHESASLAKPPTSSENANSGHVAAVDNSSAAQPQQVVEPTPWSKGLIAIQQKFEERMHKRHAERAAKLHEWALRRQERRTNAAHSTIQEFQNMSTLSRDLQALHERFGKRIAERRAHTKSATDEFGNLTRWAHDVKALQSHFEKEFVPHADHMPAHEAIAATPQADNMTDWSHNLQDLQHRLEARMEHHDKVHHHIDELDAKLKAHGALGPKTNGHALLDQIAALGKEMCSDAKHQHDPKCAQFVGAGAEPVRPSVAYAAHHYAPRGDKFLAQWSSVDEAEASLNSALHQLSDKQHTWEKSFMAKVADTMQEFCSDPMHKEQHTCVKFLHDADTSKKQAWHEKFRSKIANVGSELCSNPMRKDYLICKKILAGKEHATDASKLNPSTDSEDAEEDDVTDAKATLASRHERVELHWSDVVEAQSQTENGGLRGSMHSTGEPNASTIDPNQLSRLRTSARWSGLIPSVACITLVPRGSAAKAWMNYFIDNFRLQHYEGSHQLVLVYHHDDQQAADLVHKYVDGSHILSAVSRGKDFPSASAFRFGAWVGRNADVIARWDFEAWHHPQRLSMQVRALAFSKRPASLLERWTMVDKDGSNTTVQHGEHWDSSLVAEAAWMRLNWYPLMAEEEAAFAHHAARDIVKLDGADLEVFDEAARV